MESPVWKVMICAMDVDLVSNIQCISTPDAERAQFSLAQCRGVRPGLVALCAGSVLPIIKEYTVQSLKRTYIFDTWKHM